MSNFKYHYNLCECGRPKKDTSRRCAACTTGSGAICPKCGGPMSKKSRLCRLCRFPGKSPEELAHRPWYGETPDFSGVPVEYIYALAGFVAGEGSISMGLEPNWSPRVDIGIHIDDIALLEKAQSYFGGSIYRFPNRPLADWRLKGLLPVRDFLILIRSGIASLSAIKLNDLDLALGYIDWRLSRPHHLEEGDKLIQREWHARLKAVKVRSSL